MVSGKEFFGSYRDPEARVSALQSESQAIQLAWEQESVSDCSPGFVADRENLFRALDQPTHIDENGIKASAFTDIAVRGLSVNRLLYCTNEQAVEMSHARVRAAEQVRPGVSTKCTVAYSIVCVTALRRFMSAAGGQAERRSFGVYDTAKLEDPSHADAIFLVPKSQGGKQAERSLRLDLRQLFNDHLTHLDDGVVPSVC